jgi:TRAP-type C4-dicarboxylate transport system permease small subunit
MKKETFKRALQILTIIFIIFLVLFYIPAGAGIWSDRNYTPGSAWPAIFKWSGIVAAVALFIGWLIFWNRKN